MRNNEVRNEEHDPKKIQHSSPEYQLLEKNGFVIDQNQPYLILIDRFPVFTRWGMLIAAGIMSRFEGFAGVRSELPISFWFMAFIFNILISIYWLRFRGVFANSVRWLILADLIQTASLVNISGGYESFYFINFILVMAEVSLFFPWRKALSYVFGIVLLEVFSMLFRKIPGQEKFAAYLVTGKFMLSIFTGTLLTVFGELLRREKAATEINSRSLSQITALNEVLLRLNENSLNLERLFTTILQAIHIDSDIAFSMILLQASNENTWDVVACELNTGCIGGKRVGLHIDCSVPFRFIDLDPAYIASMLPLPVLPQVIGIPMIMPEQQKSCILIIGKQTSKPFPVDKEAFLRGLAQESSMALRNAYLFAQEKEHVERMRKFEETQSTFFSAIGHELKTPLTVLKILLPSLKGSSRLSSALQKEIEESFELNVEKLEVLIADWMESSRLEAGAVNLYKQPIDFERLSENVIAQMKTFASQKQIHMTLESDNDLHKVQGEYRYLEKVLSNLVLNAIKFAPDKSKITITLQNEKTETKICVRDSGPGVPEALRERIFEKFFSAAKDDALKGSGLGLFVCKEIVNMHGGRIWEEDNPEGGGIFCFTLPNSSEEELHGQYA
jgi:K+-sensing histidine kinase KdpD